MSLTVHTAAGVLLAKYAPNPIIAFVLGFISHFLLDLIPHGDAHLYAQRKNRTKKIRMRGLVARATIDSILSILFVLFVFNTTVVSSALQISLGIAGAVLPDALVGIYELWRPRILKIFENFHFKTHTLLAIRYRDWSSGKRALAFQLGFFILLLLIFKR